VGDKYRLIPTDVPRKRADGKGMYASIISEFAGSSDRSVKVEVPGTRVPSVVAGLRRAIQASGSTVVVTQRGEDVYLVK